ncbi:MAG: choice-of-anchor D domain-containing protein [Candidatus Kapaibacterium sp.]
MKKIYLLIFLLMPCLAAAQTAQVSYIIPDIGAPGMNVYLEIIGPHDANQGGNLNFGPDSTYFGLPGDDLKIEFVNAGDADKLHFGPKVVSWDGRMISTQVFINPDLDPGEWDWEQLNSEFIIPLRVNYMGVQSQPFNFYVAEPFNMGDITGVSQRILGEAPLGKRSPRGAMLIDSAIFADDTYYVTTLDCDPNTAGNQSYLPFILLATGNIYGGDNTVLNANGGTTGKPGLRVQDGGPGGGGGGGSFRDAAPFDQGNGEDGGNGFTGGGKGGRNNSGIPGISNNYQDPGVGSGNDNGMSLNGIMPFNTFAWEASAGSPGHPFGTPGESCGDGSSCAPPGGYGGGSGYQQNSAGGSGGFATDGHGLANTAGKSHGNTMVVPIAGGSGGASGNPQNPGRESGSGGGGGGAIRIFADSCYNIEITAKGGRGGTHTQNWRGGHGSGGHAAIQSKISVNNVVLDTQPGTYNNQSGGNGRIRFDVVKIDGALDPFNGSNYQGPATDTTTWVERTGAEIRGGKGLGIDAEVWLSPFGGEWQKIQDLTAPGSAFTVSPDLSGTDEEYCLVIMQIVDSPQSGEYTDEPQYVMSQAGANLLRILPEMRAECGEEIRDTLLACTGNSRLSYTWIKNPGQVAFGVDIENSYFEMMTAGFSITDPTANQTLNPDDSLSIEIEYEYQAGTSGWVYDTLIVAFSDALPDCRIPVSIFIRDENVAIYDAEGNPTGKTETDGIYLGEICAESADSTYFIVVPESGDGITISSPRLYQGLTGGTGFSLSEDDFTGADSTSYIIKYQAGVFNPNQTRFYDTVYVNIEECPEKADTLLVYADVIHSGLSLTSGDPGFGERKAGGIYTEDYLITNTGTAEIFLQGIPPLDPPFSIDDIVPALPDTLYPGEAVTVTVSYSPPTESEGDTTMLELSSIIACPVDLSIQLTGSAVSSRIYVSDFEFDFGLRADCEYITDTLKIANMANATDDLVITGAQISGLNDINFSYEPEITNNVLLTPGDTLTLYISFDASQGPAGIKEAMLEISTDAQAPDDQIQVDLAGEVDILDIELNPADIDFGDVPVGFTVEDSFTIINNGQLDRQLEGMLDFGALSFTPPSGILPGNGGSLTMDVSLTPDEPGNYTVDYNLYISSLTDPACRDTLSFIQAARWNAVSSEITIPDSLNFGLISSCDTDTLEFSIENNSQAPFIITGVLSIAGQDGTLFSLEELDPVIAPDTVSPGTERRMRVVFDPRSSTDGFKEAYITIPLYINGEARDTTIALSGERSTGILAAPNPFDFGDVIVSVTESGTIVLENTGDWNIEIISVTGPALPEFDMTGSPSPELILIPGETTEIDVDFTPSDVTSYTDEIVVELSVKGVYNDCPGEIRIQLEGNGTPALSLMIWMPELTADPDIDNYRIPIYAKITDGEKDSVRVSINAMEILFNRSIFYPTDESNMEIIANQADLDDRLITVSASDRLITRADTLLGYLQGYTMLGNSQSTDLLIDIQSTDITTSEPVSEVAMQSGSLTINICERGGPRLLEFNPGGIILSIEPNPAGNTAEAQVSVIEAGSHVLSIYNAGGEEVWRKEFSRAKGGDKTYDFGLDISGLSSGIYFMRLQTPMRSVTKKLVIIK